MKAYVINQKNQKLSDFTRNLYCLIYNEKGELKSKKLLYVEDGIAYGNFKIDSTFVDDNYFLKTATNWMKNFKEDYSFTQKINIAHSKKSEKISKTTIQNTLDIQILPEGGNALQNLRNNYGVIVKNENNIGIEIKKGEVFDKNNKLISNFSTNQFGLGKLSFYYEKGKAYYAKFTLKNGDSRIKSIPTAEPIGVSLNVESNGTPFFRFTVATNKNSQKLLLNKSFKLLIHNTNQILERKINFIGSDNEYNIIISKNKIEDGVNIATLFDENNTPISERIFFNYDKTKLEDFKITQSNVDNDSINISLSRKNKSSDIAFFSASILPASTKAYNPSNTIISQFLLKPYVKGDIQNPSYYFSNTNRSKLKDLDLLLLTQGWSKYKWENIFNTNVSYPYQNENGISIRGTLNIEKKKNPLKIYLLSPSSSLLDFKEIKGNSFTFDNLFIAENSNLAFVAFEDKKIQKTRGYINSNTFSTNPFKISESYIDISKELEKTNPTNFYDFDRITLDEIFVKTKLTKTKYNPIFNKVTGKSIVIDENYKGTQNVIFLMSQLGFLANNYRVANNINNNRSVVNSIYLETQAEDMVSQGMSLETRERFINGGGLPFGPTGGSDYLEQILPSTAIINPNAFVRGRMRSSLRKQIYLDEINITNDPTSLEIMRVSDLSEIHYSNKEVYLYTNDSYKTNSLFNNKALKYKIKTGFVTYKEYYDPLYNTNSSLFKDYGAIYWNPNIEILTNEEKTTFKTPILDQENMILYIEGITSSGKLISIKKDIKNQMNN